MNGLDTTVVVRLLVGEPEDQAARARRFLDRLFEAGERAAVSDLVISEAYFALQYHYQVPKSEALGALSSLLESPEIHPTGIAREVLGLQGLSSAQPGFVDRLIHGEYRRNNLLMATFEKKSRKLEGVIVL